MAPKIRRVLVLAAWLVGILYIGDFLWVNYQSLRGRTVTGTVQVEEYMAVPEKNNKIEFFYNPPQTVECVHSLFPHDGDPPCWYAGRTHEKRTTVD